LSLVVLVGFGFLVTLVFGFATTLSLGFRFLVMAFVVFGLCFALLSLSTKGKVG
jgi:hypothetical protein